MRRLVIASAFVAVVLGGCGDDSVTVLDAIGDPIDDARNDAREAGLQVDVVEAALDDIDSDDTPGNVIAQDPDPGVETDAGATVTLTVVPEFVVVPKVTSLTQEQATDLLTGAGLIPDVSKVDSSIDVGDVVSTAPRPGEVVEPGSVVVVRVAQMQVRDITYIVELFDDTWIGGDFSCVGQASASYLERNNTIAIEGPDGERLASAVLDYGEIEGADPDTGRDLMCRFEVIFRDVPDVASYAIVGTRDFNDPLTFSRSDAADGELSAYFHQGEWDPYG